MVVSKSATHLKPLLGGVTRNLWVPRNGVLVWLFFLFEKSTIFNSFLISYVVSWPWVWLGNSGVALTRLDPPSSQEDNSSVFADAHRAKSGSFASIKCDNGLRIMQEMENIFDKFLASWGHLFFKGWPCSGWADDRLRVKCKVFSNTKSDLRILICPDDSNLWSCKIWPGNRF